MDEQLAGEPLEELMRVVTDQSRDFTPVMLKKWRDAGLIPSPVRRPGLGKAQGRTAIYPVGTTAQLLRILEMREEPGRFNVDRARWRLWWEGWSVETDSIRRMLSLRLDAWELSIAEFWERWEILDGTPEALSPFSDQRQPYRTLGQVKRRSGRIEGHQLESYFEDIAALVLGVASGRGANWFSDTNGEGRDLSDLRIVTKAFGIGELLNGLSRPELEKLASEIGDAMNRYSDAASPEVIRNALRLATDEELRDVRAELSALASLSTVMMRLIEFAAGTQTTVNDVLRDLRRDGGELVQGAFLVWLALRSQQGYRELRDLALSNSEMGILSSTISSITSGYKVPSRRVQPSEGSAQGVQSQCAKSLPPDSALPSHEVAS